MREWTEQATRTDFNGCARLDDASVGRTVARAKRLQVCELASCGNLTDAAAALIARGCPLLRSLVVPTCRGLTDKALGYVAEHCPRLTELDASHCRHLGGEAGLAALARCTRLERLRAHGGIATGDDLFFADAWLDLHHAEAEAYAENLASSDPAIYLVLRHGEEEDEDELDAADGEDAPDMHVAELSLSP